MTIGRLRHLSSSVIRERNVLRLLTAVKLWHDQR
jgi:hypothetical protein